MKSLPLLFLVLALGLSHVRSEPAERNILLIVTDDQSQTLGCYGDPVAATPALDRLAQESTIFTHAYATTASCSASRSVILTGTFNHANGQFGHTHDFHKFTTFQNLVGLSLPNTLGRMGYRTARIGKYHVAPDEVYAFQEVLDYEGSHRNTVAMADACAPFIRAEDSRPFFLYYATVDPHRGGGVDESSDDAFKADLFGNRPDRGEFPGVDEVFYDPEEVVVPPFLPDTPESRKELAQYYQSVARVDQGVARLIAILREAGVLNKTLIVFTADHGMAFPGAKTTTYEAGLQVPFIVFNPYGKREKVMSDALISHADIAPSLVDFAGGLDHERNRPSAWIDPDAYWAKHPGKALSNRAPNGVSFDRYHGRSWLDALGKPHAAGRDVVYGSHTFHEIQMYYPMRTIRDRKYKLIWNIAYRQPYPFASDLWAASTWQAQFTQGPDTPYGTKTVREYMYRPEFELFDIRRDPWEGENLAGQEAYAEVLEEYKGRLKAFQEATDDPWVLKWRYE